MQSFVLISTLRGQSKTPPSGDDLAVLDYHLKVEAEPYSVHRSFLKIECMETWQNVKTHRLLKNPTLSFDHSCLQEGPKGLVLLSATCTCLWHAKMIVNSTQKNIMQLSKYCSTWLDISCNFQNGATLRNMSCNSGRVYIFWEHV